MRCVQFRRLRGVDGTPLLAAFEAVEQEKERDGDARVDRGAEELIKKKQRLVMQAEQAAVDQEQQRRLQQRKEEDHEHARGQVFDIDPDAR